MSPPRGCTGLLAVVVDNQSLSLPVIVSGGPVSCPAAGFTGTPVSGTTPLTVAFTGASANSPLSGNWSFGDGDWFNTTDLAAVSPSPAYTVPGTYMVSLTVSNTCGSNTMTRAGFITVSSVKFPPVADFTGPPLSGAQPLVAISTDSSDIIYGTMCNLSFGDGIWSNDMVSTNPAPTYPLAGTYTAALTVTNASDSPPRTRAGYSIPATPTPTPAPPAGRHHPNHSGNRRG